MKVKKKESYIKL